ncbi:MAG: ShlB/FhaC/HecB family hemolysin secretion/activation protein [Endomicrobium sp.]|jgi:hemolysin activation/secretion protein|nr:ShlB/FhaC/HecB family hemolysin secretion/activation protein [Endomicrobium sp.]
MKRILLIATITAIFINVSFAATPEEIQRNIDTMYKEYIRQMEIENRSRFTRETEKPQQKPLRKTSGPKKRLKKIDVRHSEVPGISEKEINGILAPYSELNIGAEDISDIQQKLQQLYFDAGYASARIYIDGNTIAEDILTFVIVDGYIEDIVFKRKSGRRYSGFSQSLQRFSFYPFPQGCLLNIKDLDQGIEQMNRLQTGNAAMEILPGSKNGYSVVEVTNNAEDRFTVNFGADNSGIKSTGIYKADTSVNIDNLFMLNDNIYFNYSRNIDGNYDNKASNSYFASLSIPFGYFTFMFSSFYSDYDTPPGINIGSFRTDGSTNNNNASLEMVIKRSQSYKLSAGAEMAVKDTKNNVSGEEVSVSSRKLSTASGFLTSTHYIKSGSLYTKLSYSRGLDVFDAAKNNEITGAPKAQFDSYGLYARYSAPFEIPLIGLKSSYSASLNAQYSPDILYASEQVSIGGQSSVRGFKEGSVSGDRGGYFRNDLYWTLSSIFGRNGWLGLLNKTSINGFIDYGYARHEAYGQDYQLAGSGAGASFSTKYFNASFSWSRSIYNESYLEDEGSVLYCRVEAKMSF